MSQPINRAWSEPPAGEEEVLLAEFLDETLAARDRGENVSPDQLLGPDPALLERGRGLLQGLEAVLAAAAGLHQEEIQLQSDLISLSGSGEDVTTQDATSSPEPFPDPFPGEFRICRRLGVGAFGAVWLADDLHLDRPVALKTLRSAGGPLSAERLARLRAEAQMLAALEHPNVVRVHAWRETEPAAAAPEWAHCLVLQYVSGGSLADRVKDEGPLTWQSAARYVADVGEGLLAVHARGLIHRDVKPANILWDPARDEAVLTDFGVSARLAETGTRAGTPVYMPPEAFAGILTPSQDVYGLAASLFWLVTGSFPFPGPAVADIVAQVQRGLPDPDSRCAALPATVERLLRDGLAADPERRPSLRDFIAALRGALNRLLADSLLQSRGPGRAQAVSLMLTVSRQVERHTFVPVASTRPAAERFVRDLRRVPPSPEQVEVRTGERLRLEVEADRAGHVTVFNVGPTGNLNLLFPETPGAGAVVEPGRPLHVLDIELSPPAGSERVFALWSRNPLPLRPDELRHLAEGGGLPHSEPYRATRDLNRVQESLEQLGPEEWQVVVLGLDHRPSLEKNR
jgi:serine/threonine protein kinase